MKRTGLVLFLILIGAVLAWAQWSDWKANRDWKTVERLIGAPGQVEGDGFKVTVPRNDLNVLVHGALVDPRAGLASWFSFKPLPKGSLLIGDLVVTDVEAAKVEAQIASTPLTLTSIYRPFNGETPGIERIRFIGRGPRIQLARQVRALLAATTMSFQPSAAETALTPAQTVWGLPIEKTLGPGQWLGRNLTFSFVPTRPVTEEGVEVPSYMGLATTFTFQSEGKLAKVYGQWVLTPEEARKVTACLMKNHVVVTGIHSDLLTQTPALVDVDFWAEGEPDKIARNLKEALSQTQLVTPSPTPETHPPQT